MSAWPPVKVTFQVDVYDHEAIITVLDEHGEQCMPAQSFRSQGTYTFTVETEVQTGE